MPVYILPKVASFPGQKPCEDPVFFFPVWTHISPVLSVPPNRYHYIAYLATIVPGFQGLTVSPWLWYSLSGYGQDSIAISCKRGQLMFSNLVTLEKLWYRVKNDKYFIIGKNPSMLVTACQLPHNWNCKMLTSFPGLPCFLFFGFRSV